MSSGWTPRDVIERMLPFGTSQSDPPKDDWAEVPFWPPDVFAVAAKIIELSGSISEPGIVLSTNTKERRAKSARAKRAAKNGRSWREDVFPPARVELLWKTLIQNRDRDLVTTFAKDRRWKLAALELMATADEASYGIGFTIVGMESVFVTMYTRDVARVEAGKSTVLLGQLPSSLCVLVPDTEVCIQPKNAVPNMGCTLRSLSNHLCMLPHVGVVETYWRPSLPAEPTKQNSPLNVLLVPFPYEISGDSFEVTVEPNSLSHGYFSVKQSWLNEHPVQDLCEFILGIVAEAQKEVGTVDGLVFPELAFTEEYADQLAWCLYESGVFFPEFICCGASADGEAGGKVNKALMYTADPKNPSQILSLFQRKHHRWRVDASQVKQYHIGHALNPSNVWWEDIEIGSRSMEVSVFRDNITVSTLVCEDLARFDPVMPALTALGPNLVIALLMDGPQLTQRWPNRYATVLADDPGSAVLTLTSLGMVLRSHVPGQQENLSIALWRDGEGTTHEIRLPNKKGAIVLTLAVEDSRQTTIDQRVDSRKTNKLTLAGIRALGQRL